MAEVDEATRDKRVGSWIQTCTARKIYPLDPRVEDIDILDIAHGLANQCRFVGQTRGYRYSIAQHSTLVYSYLAKHGHCPMVCFQGLMHDASEAYINDIPRPVKHTPQFEFYRSIEDKLQRTIYRKFKIPQEEYPIIKVADRAVLVAEAESLMSPLHPEWEMQTKNGYARWPLKKIKTWKPQKAELVFLRIFLQLTGAIFDGAQ